MSLPQGKNLTKQEAAERLQVCTRTVERWVAEGILRVVSIKWRTKFIQAEDVEFLERGGSPDELRRRNLLTG